MSCFPLPAHYFIFFSLSFLLIVQNNENKWNNICNKPVCRVFPLLTTYFYFMFKIEKVFLNSVPVLRWTHWACSNNLFDMTLLPNFRKCWGLHVALRAMNAEQKKQWFQSNPSTNQKLCSSVYCDWCAFMKNFDAYIKSNNLLQQLIHRF